MQACSATMCSSRAGAADAAARGAGARERGVHDASPGLVGSGRSMDARRLVSRARRLVPDAGQHRARRCRVPPALPRRGAERDLESRPSLRTVAVLERRRMRIRFALPPAARLYAGPLGAARRAQEGRRAASAPARRGARARELPAGCFVRWLGTRARAHGRDAGRHPPLRGGLVLRAAARGPAQPATPHEPTNLRELAVRGGRGALRRDTRAFPLARPRCRPRRNGRRRRVDRSGQTTTRAERSSRPRNEDERPTFASLSARVERPRHPEDERPEPPGAIRLRMPPRSCS